MREREKEKKKDKEDKEDEKRKKEKREKVAKKRKRLGDEILESSILRVRGDSRGTAAWNRCIREKREERESADSWMVMEEDRKRFDGQPYPDLLLAMPALSESLCCNSTRTKEDSSCSKISLRTCS